MHKFDKIMYICVEMVAEIDIVLRLFIFIELF